MEAARDADVPEAMHSPIWGTGDGLAPGAEGAGADEASGRGMVLTVDPSHEFWKDCPVEPGCVLELPTERRTEAGIERSLMAVFVKSMEIDESGLWVTVRFLGGQDTMQA